MTKLPPWFKETIASAAVCGLTTWGEATLNMRIHYPFAASHDYQDFDHMVEGCFWDSTRDISNHVLYHEALAEERAWFAAEAARNPSPGLTVLPE